VDTRDTPEQAELRRSARQLARDLGPGTVAGLDDEARAARLASAVRDAGWSGLRDDGGAGEPLASGVEAAIVAEALGERIADVPFAGPLLAADLARRAGVNGDPGAVAFSPALTGVAVVDSPAIATDVYAIDAGGAAYVLVPNHDGYQLATVRASAGARGADLTRAVYAIPAGTPVHPVAEHRPLTDDDLAGWEALGLALASADLVGVMRGVLDVTVDYAKQRQQFGVPVGSFQAVQHLLAEAHCLMEGSSSIALHASWAVDDLEPVAGREAGRAAKAYCARAARTVCETAVQVHGGIGNTWECIVHVYLRRALLSTQWFGDDSEQLGALTRERLAVSVGLP
jgi:alkylation response protein AidB-like acyl-CoA dehydrogenase